MSDISYEDVVEWFAQGQDEEQVKEIRDSLNAAVPVEEPEELPYWAIEDEPKKIQLGGKTINLINRGRAQLKQIGMLKEWLSIYGKPLIDEAFPDGKMGDAQGGNNIGSIVDLFINLLDADSLCELGCIITMEEKEFVEEEFDIGWVIDGASIILKYQPALKRLTSGFFGRMG